MRAVRCWYGSTQLPRIFCRKCQQWSIVLHGLRQCCDTPTTTEIIKHKRMIPAAGIRRRPPKKVREALLLQYQNCCAYCTQTFGNIIFYHGKPRRLVLNWDHELPFAYIQTNPDENFLPSCQCCNAWKHAKIFQTIEEVKVYVAIKWEAERRIEEKVRTMRKVVRNKAWMETVLHQAMPMANMG